MKTITLATVLLGVFLAFTTSSCHQGPIVKGSKNYITKEIPVGEFTSIKLSGSANITYEQSPNTHVEVYGSDNILALLDIFTDGGTLTIKYKKNVNIINPGKLEIKVSSPDLNELNINGSGNISFTNGINTQGDIKLGINGSGDIHGASFKCENLSISINGSGDIKLNDIQSKACSAHISGSGDIMLSGQATDAEYHISGSGDISATELKAANVNATISGSGDISCSVSNKLSGRVNGSGGVSYKGNPQEIDFPQKKLHKID